MKKRILIVDDEEIIRLSLQEWLKDQGYQVETACNSKEAFEKIKGLRPQIIFLDIRLKSENGLDILPEIKKLDLDNEVVMMTAYGDTESTVKSIKLGAYDYINKPFDLQEIDLIINRIINNLELQKKVDIFEKVEKENQFNVEHFIGEHPLMKDVFKKIEILSKNDEVTVLIRGDTGTGKEITASAIHKNSIRKDATMLKINCGSIPHQLIESELFGFEKNAFTGANERKKGLMEIADGGTVFLDEVGEMPMELQTKLLRFLEERKFKRVGGLEDIEVDIRIIAATNKNLEEAIKNKEFREDLYYRLNVVPIILPPLRDRGNDILILANKFLKEFSKKFNKKISGFTKNAEEALLKYYWYGNIRELKNVIERVVLLTDSNEISKENLPLEINNYENLVNKSTNINENELYDNENETRSKIFNDDFSLEDEVEKMEVYYIKIALAYCNNNHTKAAEMLKLSRFSFKRRLEKYL
ncbi:MAG: two component system response regulator, sigma54-specific [Bacillota bacterium]|nr:two component system response regulator, sigma54-specific [Bacillota bacterium]